MTESVRNYGWKDSEEAESHGYLMPCVEDLITRSFEDRRIRICDLGCGNGFTAGRLADAGHDVTGIDVAADGVALAAKTYPRVRFLEGSVYDSSLAGTLKDSFDCVVTLEVIEHLYYPRRLLQCAHAILKPGGILIVSTPYHGYLKNLAISVIGGWDKHFDVGWDGGHIKFFSRNAIENMCRDAGFSQLTFRGTGRFAGLWKSMIVTGRR